MVVPQKNTKQEKFNLTGFLRAHLPPCPGFVPLLALLLFSGALFWAKGQDPFSRKWFTVRTTDHGSVKCAVVLPRPARTYPVLIYANGTGGNLMHDGRDLRQMAELGFATVSLEYDQSNEAVFNDQFEAVQRYVIHQKWANTNAIAWLGFGLGANQIWNFALQHPNQQPHLLVQLSGAGVDQSDFDSRRRGDESQTSLKVKPESEPPQVGSNVIAATNLHCPVLLIHGDQDETYPVDDARRFLFMLQTNDTPAELKILPGVSHDIEPVRGAVFRCIGEYCLTHLMGKDAWQNYRSIAQWQAEAPPFWVFCLPAMAWVAGWFSWRWQNDSSPLPFPRLTRGKRNWGRRFEITLRWLAAVLAISALTDAALHLLAPQFAVSDGTLSIARLMLVQPKEQADFETLARQPIWRGQKLRTLLDHVELSNYNRALINWQIDGTIYRDYVLSPVITPATVNAQMPANFNWRRPMWEEFYPRIRHESSPANAANIVARHLRERVTIASAPGLPHDVSGIWLRQITDPTGFEIIYVAALRSAGVPARLDKHGQAELFDGEKWQSAPQPVVSSFDAW
jgi:acetyl esterase/lipase